MAVSASLMVIGQVALGGALGATARYLMAMGLRGLLGSTFPWGTFAVNVLGSALMGLLVVLLAEKGGMRFAPFLLIGVLGGFTTFSTFSLDVFVLYERGTYGLAAVYVMASVLLSVAALFAAMAVTRWALA